MYFRTLLWFLLVWCFMKWNLLVNPKLSPLLQINSRRYKTADTWKRRLKFTKAENEQSFSSHCNFIKLWWPTITTLTLFCNILLFLDGYQSFKYVPRTVHRWKREMKLLIAYSLFYLSKKSMLRRKHFVIHLLSRKWNIFNHMILKAFLSHSFSHYIVDIYFIVYLWSRKEYLITKVI